MSSEESDAIRQESGQESRKISPEPVWKIVWSKGLSMGIPDIDAEHQRFVGLVNELNAAISERKPKADAQKILGDILVDVMQHFQHEQQLFATHGYPDAGRHTAIHADIIKMLTNVWDQFDHADFSADWIDRGLLIKHTLVIHMLEEDMKYRDWLVRLEEPKGTNG